MDDGLFSDLNIDETKRMHYKRKYLRKMRKGDYLQRRRALEIEIQRAKRIEQFKIPIEDYDPNQMLHALRSFREAAFRQDLLHLQDINMFHEGIILDGSLLKRLVDFWKNLPNTFSSHITATNLNKQTETLISNFNKTRQRITVISPPPLTSNIIAKGITRLIELRTLQKNVSTDTIPKEVEKERRRQKENFEEKLLEFETKIKQQMDENAFISWERILPPKQPINTLIRKAHLLSYLTFSTNLRLTTNGFIYIQESQLCL